VAEIEDHVRSAVGTNGAPSIAFGISKGTDCLTIGAAGLAVKETNGAATPDTAYSLASVTKPLTTTALMVLVERGLIDLDAPINEYLGPAKVEGKAGDAGLATVRRVADHTSGLPRHYQFFYADEPYRRPEMDETIRRYAKLFTAPGERYYYSNLGYGLLDSIIGRVSGQDYSEFMTREVFGPLGMANASIGSPKNGNEAASYGPDGVAYPLYDFDHPGGSAAYASVVDLLKFGNFHLGKGPPILRSDSMLQLHEPSGSPGYALGWGVEDRHGLRLVQHTGGMGGVDTILRIVPSLEAVIVVLINGQANLAFRLADDALAAIDSNFRAGLVEERLNPKPPAGIGPLPSEFIGSWTGIVETYAGDRPIQLDIRSEVDAVATLNGNPSPISDLGIRDNRLVGVFDGDIATDDASRRPHRIHLDLSLQNRTLSGAALTVSTNPNGEGGAPGKRLGNALAYWLQCSQG
jgi:CubicO group peptidase (beta-lactamase class C family)